MPSALLVTDSSALFGLDRVGKLDLLPALFPVVIVPRRVAKETGVERSWMEVRDVPDMPVLRLLRAELDDGEAEAIALATTLDGCDLLIDERKGRRVARLLGLSLIGTITVLIRAKDQGLLGEIKPVLDALTGGGFRISKALYAEALRVAGEDGR